MPGRDILIFLHIPKTGGKSLRAMLHKALPRVMDIYSTDDVRRFSIMSMVERGSIDAYIGHMPYGLHEFLPRKARYITFLRDPVDLAVSNYYYIRSEQRHDLHKAFQGLSLQEYSQGAVHALDNLLVRHLGDYDTSLFVKGVHWERRYADPCDRARVQEALSVLKRCDFVGDFSNFNADVARLFSRYGLGEMSPMHVNATVGRPRLSEIEGSIVGALVSLNQFDFNLLELAQHLNLFSFW